jgi:putative ABC transport system substrate-binding protein
LPAIYAQREFVTGGGLMSYSADFSVQFHDAAGYVDRILKGDKPADLPVQAPTRYELVINLFQQFINSIVDAMGYGQIGEALGTA